MTLTLYTQVVLISFVFGIFGGLFLVAVLTMLYDEVEENNIHSRVLEEDEVPYTPLDSKVSKVYKAKAMSDVELYNKENVKERPLR